MDNTSSLGAFIGAGDRVDILERLFAEPDIPLQHRIAEAIRAKEPDKELEKEGKDKDDDDKKLAEDKHPAKDTKEGFKDGDKDGKDGKEGKDSKDKEGKEDKEGDSPSPPKDKEGKEAKEDKEGKEGDKDGKEGGKDDKEDKEDREGDSPPTEYIPLHDAPGPVRPAEPVM